MGPGYFKEQSTSCCPWSIHAQMLMLPSLHDPPRGKEGVGALWSPQAFLAERPE